MDKEKLSSLLDAGSDILSQVNGAVKTGDYMSLNSGIRTTLENTAGINPTAAETVVQQSDRRAQMQERMKETMKRQQEKNAAMSVHGGKLRQNSDSANSSSQKVEPVYNKKAFRETPFQRRKVSRFEGTGYIVGGIIIVLLTLVSSLGLIIAAAIFGGVFASRVATVLILLLIVLGIVLIVRGVGINQLAKRFQEYALTAGDKTYITVKKLGNASGQTEKETVKDLIKMKKKGYLPYAEFDESRTTLMLTSEVIEEYKQTISAKLEEERLELAERASKEKLPTDALKLIEDGESYVKKVREYNDKIPDNNVMSDKLYRLEDIMNRIFVRVRKNPSNTADLRKFMSYYLPTTEKLLNAYVSLSDDSAGTGEKVQQTKNEIEATMDTICDAYENILDEMFDDIALDVSSDISVMKTMMQQDGIAETDDFNKRLEK